MYEKKMFSQNIRYRVAGALQAMQQQRAPNGAHVRIRGGSVGAAPTYVRWDYY